MTVVHNRTGATANGKGVLITHDAEALFITPPSDVPASHLSPVEATFFAIFAHCVFPLPFLQVRILALDIIAQSARSTAPAALKPLLPGLVQAMLEGLSSLEDSR